MSRLTENLKGLEEMGKLDRYIMSILENSLEEHDKEIRNKTIDEFADELINHSIYADIGKGNEVKMEWASPVTRIKEVAEQMKVVRNEQ